MSAPDPGGAPDEMTDLLTGLRASVTAARQRGAISDDEWAEREPVLARDPYAWSSA